MKRLFFTTLVLFLALSATAQTPHLKFTQSGKFASVSGSTGPNSSFSLTVSVNDSSVNGDTATLSYEALSIASDFNSETFTTIMGAIPNSAFTGQNTTNLTLSFDTSQLDPTTSDSLTCTIDLTTFIETCGPPATGLIQVTFQENDIQRFQVLHDETVTTMGPITTRTKQSSDSGTANAQGSIFGTPVSSATASVGVNHSSTRERINSN